MELVVKIRLTLSLVTFLNSKNKLVEEQRYLKKVEIK